MRSSVGLLACFFVLSALARAAWPPPQGWTVSEAPIDPAMAALSNEQVIDQLVYAEPDVRRPWSSQQFWPIGGIPRVGQDVPFQSSAAIELVRRGLRVLPALLAHLTDARPTRMVYAVREPRPGGNSDFTYSDEYDPRNGARPLAGVNTKARRKIDEEGTYTFKVGDLCYAAIGQIVGRDLAVVRSSGEDADGISGAHSANPGDRFLEINSPVATPALAEAVRTDWNNLTADEHLELLRAQVAVTMPRHPHLAPGLTRLLFYYPSEGAPIAERLLRRKLDDNAKGPGSDDLTNSWNQADFLPQVEPYRWDHLRDVLLENLRASVRLTDEALALLPPNTWQPSVPSLGSDRGIL